MKCKILIVDDDSDDVELLTEAFSQSGVDGVHHVHTAMQAFIYLEQEEHECLPRLIIVDLYLPGITGSEFLHDLKGMDKYKHIHVVILSSSKSPEQVKQLRELGAVDYLVKPSTYEDYVKVANGIKARLEQTREEK